MNKKWLYAVSAVLLIGIAIGCTDSTTETGSGLPSGGFIKGTVTTARQDGKPVTFNFEHSLVDYPTEWYPEYGSNYVYIYRAKDFEGDWTGDNRSQLYFYLDSLNQDTVSFLYYFRLNEVVALQNDTVMPFRMSLYYPGPGTITNYHYNKSDGTVSGDFHLSTSNTNNGQSATVTGSFKSDVRIVIDNNNN